MGKVVRVKLDYDRICEELNAQKKTKTWLSLEIGRSRSYFANLPGSIVGTSVPGNVEALISKTLGYEPGTFVKYEKSENVVEDAPVQAKFIETLYSNQAEILNKMDVLARKLGEIEKQILYTSRDETAEKQRQGEVIEHLEFIRIKSNANTLQLEKIKGMLIDMNSRNLDAQERMLEEITKEITKVLGEKRFAIGEPTRNRAYDLLDKLIVDRNGVEQSQVFAEAAEKNISRKDMLRAKNEMQIQVISRGVGNNSKKYWCKGY